MSKISTIFFIILFMFHNAMAQEHNLIPRKVLFDNPDKTSVKLSHDGKYISYLAPLDGVLNIFIASISEPQNAKAITNDKGRGIRTYHWAYDNEHILYNQDNQGDENYRIYSYNLKTNSSQLLTPESGVRAMIYGMSHRLPNLILVGTNERNKKYFDIFKINLENGTKELILENNRFASFSIDDDLKIRFGVNTTKDGGEEYFQFKDEQWLSFFKIDVEDNLTTGLIGFDKTGQNIYMLDSRGRNTGALKILNIETGISKSVFEDQDSDVGIFAIHPTENTIQAVSIDYEKQKYFVIDDAISKDLEYLKAVDVGQLHINSRTLDDNLWLIAYTSDISAVKYYIYNCTEKKAQYLFNNRKALKNYELSPMIPVIIKSRDNLSLVSYLTLPTGITLQNKENQKPIPIILDVHGGPWVRDHWGFNPIHQLFANRGYGVLSVNFRGSTGFGKDFINASNKQWGKKMHDDLVDAVHWAIDNNIADPKKIAIMGGSYGGYATLVGMTFTPELFACGVDLVGPSNLLTLIDSIPPYWEPIIDDFKKRVGPWDTKEEREFLASISPINHIDKITKPLFIAQGVHDPRVKQNESDQIVSAMRSKNIPVIYALYQDEGHGFIRPENKLSYFAMIEQFLSKVLGGKAQAIDDDLRGADFILNGEKNISSESVEKAITEAISK
ncbi:MAG: S9 family peptidase [Rickettsiaceae bacterium]|nr:MAG: S9 family peptidase [Rickettsiaceae bacterium]